MSILYLFALLMLPSSLGAQARDASQASRSPREFAEGFYQWYVPRAFSGTADGFWNGALKYKRSAFGPQLAKLLREDLEAQAKCRDLVGLDFDPFLGTQEPAERYVVGRVRQQGRTYLADIYAVRYGQQGKEPDVTAQFTEEDGHWFFVNFRYPDGSDLMTILKLPRLPCSRPR